MSLPPERVIQEAAHRAATIAEAPLLLAVSGGLDSMALLHAMASVARERIAAVATFDHGTGEFATNAAARVASETRRLGLPLVSGRIDEGEKRTDGLEAMWRAARYRFLRDRARELGAIVTTAHTCDDQVETVLMREMRGSGARGLAGLAAPSDVLRPFLEVRRSEIEQYATTHGLRWVEDPSNSSPAFFRNRIRTDVLPALRRADAHIDASLLAIARRAAAWRAELDEIAAAISAQNAGRGTALLVAQSELAGYDRDSLCVLWGALAGRVGLSLDRRGTHRCATFTMKSPRAGSIPLSGGWLLQAGRGGLELRRAERVEGQSALPSTGSLTWGSFRFSVDGARPVDDRWSATLSAGGSVIVRRWMPGDRLAASRGLGTRRVKRYLSDAGMTGTDRQHWPVVLVNDEVVWIPGVRRSDAATVRSGGPARHFVCERTLD